MLDSPCARMEALTSGFVTRMLRLFPLIERRMMVIVAAATNLGGNRHFGADRRVPHVGNVTRRLDRDNSRIAHRPNGGSSLHP